MDLVEITASICLMCLSVSLTILMWVWGYAMYKSLKKE